MNTPTTQHYVYYMLPCRTVKALRAKEGDRLSFANAELAKHRAAFESTKVPYPFFTDTNPALDNTRDGRLIAA